MFQLEIKGLDIVILTPKVAIPFRFIPSPDIKKMVENSEEARCILKGPEWR